MPALVRFSAPLRAVSAVAGLSALLWIAGSGSTVAVALAQRSEPLPEELEGVGIEEMLDIQLPLDAMLTDETGKEVPLRTFFDRERPVILNLGYYGCPMLCGLVTNGLLASLKEQISSIQDEVLDGMLQMIGKDDIFTKAALSASIRNLEDNVRQSDSNQWRPWLQLYGFRIVVDVHGQVVEIIYPSQPADDD